MSHAAALGKSFFTVCWRFVAVPFRLKSMNRADPSLTSGIH